MPRKYVKTPGSRSYGNYREEQMNLALKAVQEEGFSVNAAAEAFGVKRETLRNRVKGTHCKKIGGQLAIQPEDEQELAKYFKKCAEWGFPLDIVMIRQVVKGYLEKINKQIPQFVDNTPGVEWVKSFLHRNDLVNKRIKNISNARAEVTIEQLDSYFDNLTETISGVPPGNILNYDETCMHDDPGKKRGVAGKGQKYVERKLNTTKSGITVMFAGTGDGELLPPYIVYKSENMWDTWREGGPKGARYNRSLSGWFDANIFEDWFFQIALPFLKKKEGTKVLIGDNLGSHLSAGVLDGCLKNNIHYVFLPANASHLCQPLDVGFYGPLKTAWRKVLMNFKLTNPGKAGLPKECFPKLISQLMTEMEHSTSKCLKSGFRRSGIYPLDRQQVYKSLPSTTVSKTPQTSTNTTSPLRIATSTPERVHSAPPSICDSCSQSASGPTTTLSPSAEAISVSVIDLLQQMRSNTQNRKKRKKRIVIEPGKSVKGLGNESVDDPSMSSVPSTSGVAKSKLKRKGMAKEKGNNKDYRLLTKDNPPKKKTRRRLKKEMSSDESETVDISPPESDCSDEDFGVQILNEIENERREEEELQDIVEGNVKPGVWVLIEGKGKDKKAKNYIGQVVSVMKEDVKIKFLKKQDKFVGDRPYFKWCESDGSLVDMGYIKKCSLNLISPKGIGLFFLYPLAYTTTYSKQ